MISSSSAGFISPWATTVAIADGEGDVLLATSIIESGLDVPRANTMLVHDAERFGLSRRARPASSRRGRRPWRVPAPAP
jgi:ERCC4-related helicase